MKIKHFIVAVLAVYGLLVVVSKLTEHPVHAEVVNGVGYTDGVEGGTTSGINSSTVLSSAVTLTDVHGSMNCRFENREASTGARIDIFVNGETTGYPIFPGQIWNTATASQPFFIKSFKHQSSSNCTACLVWACTVKN